MKKLKWAVLLIFLGVFLAWFLPIWFEGITRTPNENNCRWNDKEREMHLVGRISSIEIEYGWRFSFTLEDGSSYSFAKSLINQGVSLIAIGDSLIKPKGFLDGAILTKNGVLEFSLERPCDKKDQ